MDSDIEKAKGLLRRWEDGTSLEIECSVRGSDKLAVRGCTISSFTENSLDMEWALPMNETQGFIYSTGRVLLALGKTSFSTFGEGSRTGVKISFHGETQVLAFVRLAPMIPL